MHEIELRFHVPAAQVERLRRFVAQGGKATQTALAAIYFDSEARELARAGIGLRLRLEGTQWVQTVKGPAEDGMSRLEHNAAVGGEPQLDLARHAGHPLGERLAALQPGPLRPVFRTEILRSHRRRRVPGGELELCWDEGELRAGEAAPLAVHELELELLKGEPLALLAHAHALVARWPLSLDLRSKAERGENLARGLRQSPPRKAKGLRLKRGMSPFAALRALLLNVFEQIAHNASQIGSGASEPEHLHQLRVGLRRLRSGLRLFDGLWPALELPELRCFEAQAASWFRELGPLRDRDVLAQQPAWRAAWASLVPEPERALPAHDGGAAAAACVRQPAVQQFLIECLGWIHELDRLAAGSEPQRLRPPLRRRLRRWQRSLQADCARFAELDTEARHRLRRRMKRLRYAAEFCRGLFDERQTAAALAPLLQAQAWLGELNDLELALASCRARPLDAAQAGFELGWLMARRDDLLARAQPLMQAVVLGPALLPQAGGSKR